MKIKIDSDVPVPAVATRSGKWLTLSRRMNVGDSVLLPKKQAYSLKTSLSNNGFKVVTRTEDMDLGLIRVWKLEKIVKQRKGGINSV